MLLLAPSIICDPCAYYLLSEMLVLQCFSFVLHSEFLMTKSHLKYASKVTIFIDDLLLQLHLVLKQCARDMQTCVDS